MSLQQFVRDNTAFAIRLDQELKDAESNLFFSPYSISTALAMAYAGSRGKTAEQMANALNFSLSTEQLHPAFAELKQKIESAQADGSIQIKIANALWPQSGYPFSEEYLALIRANYGEQVTPLDYSQPEAARATINTWVEEKTEAKIKDLIPAGLLNPLTRLVLTNAIYFKGSWAHPFWPEITQALPFQTETSESVTVPFMRQENDFGYREISGIQIIELPYEDEALSMVILLPPPGKLTNLEANLTTENLKTWLSSLSKRKVNLYLPRFKFSAGFSLNDALKTLGMIDAFSSQSADFSGMDGIAHRLYIGAVLHKAFVDVNESGTEAAAATAVGMQLLGFFHQPPVVFRADHPFLFLIRERETGTILFFGRVVNPILEE